MIVRKSLRETALSTALRASVSCIALGMSLVLIACVPVGHTREGDVGLDRALPVRPEPRPEHLVVGTATGVIHAATFDPDTREFRLGANRRVSSRLVADVVVDHVTAHTTPEVVHLHIGRDDAVIGDYDIGFIQHAEYSRESDQFTGFELEPSNPSISTLVLDDVNSTPTRVVLLAGRREGGLLPFLYDHEHGIYYETVFNYPRLAQRPHVVDIVMHKRQSGSGLAHLFLALGDESGNSHIQHVIYDHRVTRIVTDPAWAAEVGPLTELLVDQHHETSDEAIVFAGRADGVVEAWKYEYEIRRWSRLAGQRIAESGATRLIADDRIRPESDVVRLHVASETGTVTLLDYTRSTSTFTAVQTTPPAASGYSAIALGLDRADSAVYVGRSDGNLVRMRWLEADQAYSVDAMVSIDQPISVIAAMPFGRESMGLTDRFGSAVALSGTTALIGAPGDNGRGVDSGAAYLVDVSTGRMLHKLVPQNGRPGDFFGSSVAISGGIAVVGAPGSDRHGSNSGAAWAFDARTGRLIRELTIPEPMAGERFGASVATNGTHVVVGAPWFDSDVIENTGRVFVFDGSAGEPRQLLPVGLTRSCECDGRFGASVDMSGDTIAVGSWADNDGGYLTGSVTLFQHSHSEWKRDPKILGDNSDDLFGWDVALAADRLIVGAHKLDYHAIDSGFVYQFDLSNGASLAPLLAAGVGLRDWFGYSVDADERMFIVSAWKDGDLSGDDGRAFVFDRESNQIAELRNPGGERGFGRSVAISGETAIVGSRGGSRGAVHVYNARSGQLVRTLVP